jgi:multicomponent Na+:H+ antiporter subunit B
VRSFFNHQVYHIIKVGALILYAVLICYTIYVGANALPNLIPLGRPGSILSAGIILPINVAVGLEVACTMYAFYTYFGRGDL